MTSSSPDVVNEPTVLTEAGLFATSQVHPPAVGVPEHVTVYAENSLPSSAATAAHDARLLTHSVGSVTTVMGMRLPATS